jgi:hypothetical protein
VPSSASGTPSPVVGVAVGDVVAVGDPVGVDDLVADAEGDVLVDGDVFVGVGDSRALAVGLAERVAGAFDSVPRLVPVV